MIERFGVLVFLKDAGQGGRHEGLAESDYIADDDTAAFVEMVSSYLDGGFLKFEGGPQCRAGCGIRLDRREPPGKGDRRS